MDTTIEGSCSSVSLDRTLAKRPRPAEEEHAVCVAAGAPPSRQRLPIASRRGEARSASAPAIPLPKLTPTFDVPEVEDDFISFCQLTSHAPCPQSEMGARRLELLGQVADRVHLPEFDCPDAAGRICGGSLLEPLESPIAVEKWLDARSIYARLCATRLLAVSEERSVLRRMHYFRHLAAEILTRGNLNEWDLVRTHGLVKAALWHRDLMVQANMRLIVSIIKQLPIDSSWYDELISDGVVALLRAVDKFDPSRGYRFCTYATKVIRRECYCYIKQRCLDRNRYTDATILPVLVVGQGGRQPHAASDLDGRSDRAHWLEWRERLAGMMGTLTRREQVIIRSRYCLGSHRRVKTLKRLAAALKISKERVRQLELSALAKLRAAAELPV